MARAVRFDRIARRLAPAVLLHVFACASPPLEERPWLEVQSAGFTIYTDLHRQEAIALSEDAELFRAVVMKLTNATLTPRVPTRVFAFSRSAIQPFAPTRRCSGFFEPFLRENFIAVDASPGCELRESLFYEYTLVTLYTQGHPLPPLWYKVGFAELMGTLRSDGNRVVIGAAPAQYAGSSALPLYKVLRARDFERFDERDRGRFYRQSWQVVHYLMLGPGREQGDVGARLKRYILAVERGEDDERAFSEAFGMSFEELEDAVEVYHAAFKLPAFVRERSRFEMAGAGTVREMSAVEAAETLGEFALNARELELAQGFFERALAGDPARARAHAGLGDVLRRTGHASEAETHYAKALALAPDDYRNHLERAESLHALAEREGRMDLLGEARAHYARAIELAPEIPEGHLMLGRTYLLPGEVAAAGVAPAERARALLPGHPLVHFTLAQLYARTRQRDAAIASARRSLLWSPDRENDEAEALLESLLAPAPTATSN